MIPYNRQYIDNTDIDSVLKCLQSDFLTTGPYVERFEEELCKLTGAKYAIACCNGTAALHLAVMSANISKGDWGLTSPITFLASANSIEYCDCETDFIDIDSENLCMSVEKLEDYCRHFRIPKLVIPVDFSGVPSRLPEIWELSRKYGFIVIEDAAHAVGSSYFSGSREYACGGCAHSDLAIMSFHPVKNITTGEGGAILTNNRRYAEKARLLRNHGIIKNPVELSRNDGPWYYEMQQLGFNYRITDLQCALGISQLQKLQQFKTERQRIVAIYNQAFSSAKDLITPPWPENTSPCFHLYPLQFRKGHNSRKSVFYKLLKMGFQCQVHYIPVYWQPYYRNKYDYIEGKCPNAEKYYSGCLSLPLFTSLKDEQVKIICEIVLSES